MNALDDSAPYDIGAHDAAGGTIVLHTDRWPFRRSYGEA
jgi:hypothetical protein